MSRLGINIDHVATLRNARGEDHPNILEIAKIVKSSGANSITIHLREDRRHINDKDLSILCNSNFLINMEMAANFKMMNIALKNKPKFVCIVPGKISRLVKKKKKFKKEFLKIKECSKFGKTNNVEIHAGHGLDYKTTKILSKINEITEYNIGHFIIGESIKIGISKVIRKFKKIIK